VEVDVVAHQIEFLVAGVSAGWEASFLTKPTIARIYPGMDVFCSAFNIHVVI
jgi:hypothetical protein